MSDDRRPDDDSPSLGGRKPVDEDHTRSPFIQRLAPVAKEMEQQSVLSEIWGVLDGYLHPEGLPGRLRGHAVTIEDPDELLRINSDPDLVTIGFQSYTNRRTHNEVIEVSIGGEQINLERGRDGRFALNSNRKRSEGYHQALLQRMVGVLGERMDTDVVIADLERLSAHVREVGVVDDEVGRNDQMMQRAIYGSDVDVVARRWELDLAQREALGFMAKEIGIVGDDARVVEADIYDYTRSNLPPAAFDYEEIYNPSHDLTLVVVLDNDLIGVSGQKVVVELDMIREFPAWLHRRVVYGHVSMRDNLGRRLPSPLIARSEAERLSENYRRRWGRWANGDKYNQLVHRLVGEVIGGEE